MTQAPEGPATPKSHSCLFDFESLDSLEASHKTWGGRASNPSSVSLDHFLTFGNGPFAAAAHRLAAEVSALGHDVFQRHHILTALPEPIRSDPKWHGHLSLPSKGYGWWFWKPALVNYLLGQGELLDGDTLTYVDAGCVVGSRSLSEWLKLLSHVGPGDAADLVAFQHENLECNYTKGDVFARFGVDLESEVSETAQLVGGYWLLRIGPKTRRFLELWETLAEDLQLISDSAEVVRNPRLVEHRRDQSLFSMLVKCNLPSSKGHQHEFEVDGLKILLLKDIGWPATGDPRQPLAACRRTSEEAAEVALIELCA